MGLLKPRPSPSPQTLRRLHGVVICPFNGHQTGWCRGLCVPVGAVGACGRPAPHALTSRVQAAIAAYVEAQRREREERTQ